MWKNPVTTRPSEMEPEDKFGLKVVAVIGVGPDWAAYMGFTDWPDEMVATNGDKITKEAAENLFPAIARTGREYRR